MTDPSHIRNFSIIAHIDHGKSTLPDRVLEMTGTVAHRDMQAQLLDSMDIERERGITIKSQAVRVNYTADDGETYQFNLIDTPGHVDFTYEVSRSLAACEGAVLVVDATQGVEAQTVANAMMAMNANLEIIPLINKIDLPSAEPERVKAEIEDGLAIPADDAVLASGKTGVGVHDLLEAVVYNIPAPQGDAAAPLRALIFDSYFDPYRGVVALVRVVDGAMHKGQKLKLMATGKIILAEEVGARHPAEEPLPQLGVGEVGYLVTGLKDLSQVKVGDTLTLAEGGVDEPLPGYREAKPWSIPVCSPSIPINTSRSKRRSRSSRSTIRRLSGSRRNPMRSASASVWAFWACCIWKWSRSAWSASSIWTCSPPRLPWNITCSARAAR